jgi:hypothetical protein
MLSFAFAGVLHRSGDFVCPKRISASFRALCRRQVEKDVDFRRFFDFTPPAAAG